MSVRLSKGYNLLNIASGNHVEFSEDNSDDDQNDDLFVDDDPDDCDDDDDDDANDDEHDDVDIPRVLRTFKITYTMATVVFLLIRQW